MTFKPGEKNCITDVPGILIGNAQDEQLKSGVTVLTSDRPLTAGVHVMGGAPGTRETDLLAADKLVGGVDALVLSGGSAFGLDAASAVMQALLQAGRGVVVGDARVPIVPAAILFDLLAGGDTAWRKDQTRANLKGMISPSPWYQLGLAAFVAAGSDFALGTAGAGTGATTADFKGGLGSASLVSPDTRIGAVVAVNAMGSAVAGDHFLAAPWEIGGEFGGLGAPREIPDPPALKPLEAGTATTIAIVATDAPLSKAQCTRLALAAHDGMARALSPAHTPFDGDLVFAVATGQEGNTPDLSSAGVAPEVMTALGHYGAVCLARAIARGVWQAHPTPSDQLPTFRGHLGLDDGVRC
ncbi:MAG: P1 family peptidase [Pseudomonadota bacterium]